jgi:hypothetical protein
MATGAPKEQEAQPKQHVRTVFFPLCDSPPLQVLEGTTFDGVSFKLPKTSPPWNLKPWTWDLEDFMSGSCIVYLIVPFLGLPKWVPVALFVFWRLCYNVGIG